MCVIGGGINGVGIARDAAGRGLSVLLVEAQDLANATSSSSTKLVHGGLRYLEQYDFKLVRESLHERTTLLKAAPHLVSPLKFILPHNEHLRPYWMIKAGLFLYDSLSGLRGYLRKKLPKSEALDFATSNLADPLEDSYKSGFSYYDCWVDDARLVTLNAMDAKEKGATILPRTACVNLEPTADKKGWQIYLQDMQSADEFQVTAHIIVNATGPWVRKFLKMTDLVEREDVPKADVPKVKLVKGSHIMAPCLYKGDHAYILQQPDGRIVFTIPYEQNYTLIGTTDVNFEGDPSEIFIDQEEIDYLCDAVNLSFKKKIAATDLIWNYSGVRPLVDDGSENVSKVTREYKLYMDERFGPPILSVFGGKITTYRALSEQVVDRLATFYPKRNLAPWTDKGILPGGDIPEGDFEAFVQKQGARYTFLNEKLLHRYAHAYGTRMGLLMEGVNKVSDMGQDFGDDVYQKEIEYLVDHEFVTQLEDVLWRRSKLGLHISAETVKKLKDYFPHLSVHESDDDENTDTSGD